MLRVLRVIFYSNLPYRVMLRACYVYVTCHINGAYTSAPSSVNYSFRVEKQQCPRQSLKGSLEITVGHRTMSDQNQKLSDQAKKTPDILPDGKNCRQN